MHGPGTAGRHFRERRAYMHLQDQQGPAAAFGSVMMPEPCSLPVAANQISHFCAPSTAAQADC
jgi:hypothetical protein